MDEYASMMLELAALDARLPDVRPVPPPDHWTTDAIEAAFARDPTPPQRGDAE